MCTFRLAEYNRPESNQRTRFRNGEQNCQFADR